MVNGHRLHEESLETMTTVLIQEPQSQSSLVPGPPIPVHTDIRTEVQEACGVQENHIKEGAEGGW